jgi:hypothetical protein
MADMSLWKKPDVSGVVMWEAVYYWPGVGIRRTLHQPDLIEGVVHSLASDRARAIEVYPINIEGEIING